tara:strand:+ start:35346 stop:36650 length:1305 start_codon:yes stop_codon:yes gene_type:complete
MSILARIMSLNPNTGPNLGPGRRPQVATDEGINISELIGTGAAEQAGDPLQGQAAIDEANRLKALAAAEAERERLAAIEAERERLELLGGGQSTTTSDETVVENGRLIVYTITRDSEGNIVSRVFLKDLGPQKPQDSGGGPGPGTEPGDPGEQFNAREFAKANYSFLGDELLEVFISEYDTNGGDVDEALRAMRSTQSYKDKFPGIFREDGTTLRFTTATPELDYIKMQEDYFNALEDYNLNPEFFEDKVTQLFLNDVDPTTFTNRLDTAYTSLFNQFDAVKQYYVENYPGQFPTTDDISDEAIFASFISEDISQDIIAQRIKVSQIGGAFAEEQFAVSADQAQRLVSAGLSGTGAQQIAQRAEARLPRLQRLARRFTGREDIFGLSEFIESEVFGEGVAAQVRERLEAEQRTAFTQEGGAAATQAGVTGLVEQ